jgi:hypothetical protein
MSKNHASYFHKKLGKAVCDKCGLVYLKNAATQKAIQKPCPGAENSD